MCSFVRQFFTQRFEQCQSLCENSACSRQRYSKPYQPKHVTSLISLILGLQSLRMGNTLAKYFQSQRNLALPGFSFSIGDPTKSTGLLGMPCLPDKLIKCPHRPGRSYRSTDPAVQQQQRRRRHCNWPSFLNLIVPPIYINQNRPKKHLLPNISLNTEKRGA